MVGGVIKVTYLAVHPCPKYLARVQWTLFLLAIGQEIKTKKDADLELEEREEQESAKNT